MDGCQGVAKVLRKWLLVSSGSPHMQTMIACFGWLPWHVYAAVQLFRVIFSMLLCVC